jgi:ribonuclease D
LAATRRGVEAPLVKREQLNRPNDALLKRLEKLKVWRKKIAKEIEVESDIILPKMLVNSLAENPPKNLDELEAALRETPTRFGKYGAEIYRLIGG